MRFSQLAFITFFLLCGTAFAEQRFPYQAVIETEGAYVRSGPGKTYYPTDRMKRGTEVTVHRHDPGGWYMIAPPAGSFSWVRAEYVQQSSPERGTLIANNVVVRVGSKFGDEARDIEQVRLSKGDEIRIIERKTVASPTGPVTMIKIQPPAGEYRWVNGQHVAATSALVKETQDRDPFATPSHLKKYTTTDVARSRNRVPAGQIFEDNPHARNAVRRNLPNADVLTTQRKQLNTLDDAFRGIVSQPLSNWDFSQLEAGYRQLQQDAATPALAGQVGLRFDALARYRKLKGEYDELAQITQAARNRDAELLSLQQQSRRPIAQPTSNAIQPEPDPDSQFQPPTTPGQPQPEPPTATGQPPAAQQPQFDGAGIVQRAAATFPGAPRHVLLTPGGQVLAYLQAEQGIDLDRYLGQAMGLQGKRYRHRTLRADLLVVRDLTPVRLAE